MNTITQPKHTPGVLRASRLIVNTIDARCKSAGRRVDESAREDFILGIAEAMERESGFAELLDAARALSHAYLDAEPTQAKADAWTRLRAAIKAAS